jgi:hypothetical protein
MERTELEVLAMTVSQMREVLKAESMQIPEFDKLVNDAESLLQQAVQLGEEHIPILGGD